MANNLTFNQWLSKLPIERKEKLNTVRKQLDKCLDDNSRNLYYLKQRWTDEREYEDFEEYIKIFKDTFKKYGFDNLNLSKSFKITLKHLGWKTQFGLNYKGINFKYNWLG